MSPHRGRASAETLPRTSPAAAAAGRRRFDHLFAELCVALDRVVPRYALWLRVKDLGWDPDALSRDEVERFCTAHLGAFLADHGLRLPSRTLRRLTRRVRRFDPRFATPEEHFTRMGG